MVYYTNLRYDALTVQTFYFMFFFNSFISVTSVLVINLHILVNSQNVSCKNNRIFLKSVVDTVRLIWICTSTCPHTDTIYNCSFRTIFLSHESYKYNLFSHAYWILDRFMLMKFWSNLGHCIFSSKTSNRLHITAAAEGFQFWTIWFNNVEL